jgi:tetratricopeptide (TPR) repeat protein
MSESADLPTRLQGSIGLPDGVPDDTPTPPAEAAVTEPAHHTPVEPEPVVPGYHVLDEIGRGGMGVVYRAEQLSLKRVVALKMMAASADPIARARFLAEAEAVAAVRHPHVVQVHEFGEFQGRSYLGMDYLPGGTLAARLRAGRLGPHEAAGLVERIARGVGAAHEAGIVHRDVKPGNVLFDDHGEPIVTDFGLAKRAASDLTQTNAVMGTPAYMAPEQAAGKTKFVGPQADVWALGVILYEALTGAKPFPGETVNEILYQVMGADPASVRSSTPGVPRDLETVCLKCLDKEPHRRYPTANELADDLARFRAGLPVSARPTSPPVRAYRWARRNPVLAGLLAAVMVGGVGLIVSLAMMYRLAVAKEAAAEERLREQTAAAATERRLRADADAELARANQVSDLLSNMFQASDPLDVFGKDFAPPSWEKQQQMTVREFLDRAAARFRTELREQPAARARLLETIGNSYRGLGQFQTAHDLLTESLTLRREHLPADHPEIIRTEFALGTLALDRGDYDRAEALYRSVYAAQQTTGAGELERANTRFQLAWVLGQAGRAEAEPILHEVLAVRERLRGKAHPETLQVRLGMVGFLIDQNRIGEIMAQLDPIREGLEAAPEGQVRDIAHMAVGFQIGKFLEYQADEAEGFLKSLGYSRAEKQLRSALATGERTMPADHIFLSVVRHGLGQVLVKLDRDAEAAAVYARILTDLRGTCGLAHPKALVLLDDYCDVLGRLKKPAEARALFAEAAEANRERFGPENKWRVQVLLFHAKFEGLHGDGEAAARLAREALGLIRAGQAVATRTLHQMVVDVAREVPWVRHGPLAADLLRTAQGWAAGLYGEGSIPEFEAAILEARALARSRDTAGAVAAVRKAEAVAGRLKAPATQVHRHALAEALGWAETVCGRFDKAAAHWRTARGAADSKRERRSAALNLAGALVDQGQAKEAAAVMAEVVRDDDADANSPPLDRAIALKLLAAVRLAAGDKPGHAAAVREMAAKFGASGDPSVLCQIGLAAGLADGPAEPAARPALSRLAAVLGWQPALDWRNRGLYASALRDGDAPRAAAAAAKVGPQRMAQDHLVAGLIALRLGEAAEARQALARADRLIRAREPGPDRQNALAQSHWLDRLYDKLLRAELAAALARHPVEAAPAPRPARSRLGAVIAPPAGRPGGRTPTARRCGRTCKRRRWGWCGGSSRTPELGNGRRPRKLRSPRTRPGGSRLM